VNSQKIKSTDDAFTYNYVKVLPIF